MDRMRNIALILVLQERVARGQPRARRAIAAPAAERAPAARRILRQGLCYPGPHLGPKLVPRHLENRERRLAVDHAMTGVPERIHEKRNASRAARAELVDLAGLTPNRAFRQGASGPRL